MESLGWQKIFEEYDDDNRELEFEEFCKAVRIERELSVDAVSDDQIASSSA